MSTSWNTSEIIGSTKRPRRLSKSVLSRVISTLTGDARKSYVCRFGAQVNPAVRQLFCSVCRFLCCAQP